MESADKVEDLWKNLVNDYEFFLNYRETFIENFKKHSRVDSPKLVGIPSLNTLLKKLYVMLFSFQKDPREELFNLAYRLNKFEIDLKKIMTKCTLTMVRDYIDYVSEEKGDVSRIKKLIELIEIYLGIIEDAQSKYINELRKETKKQERLVAEGERAVIIEFLNKLKEQKSDEIEFINYYKQVPAVCRSKLIEVGETSFKASICNLSIFEVGEEIYLKHPRLPRTVAVKIKEIDHTQDTGEFEVIGFVDLPQERRKYVRVQPDDSIPVKIQKGDIDLTGEMADISVGGVGIYVKDYNGFAIGDVVTVSLLLPEGKVETNGVIRHITPHENLYRIGIEYRLDFKQEEIVSDYVMERQFEILRELKGVEL